MTPRKADPAKDGVSVRIHRLAKKRAEAAHIKYMFKVGNKMSMASFMGLLINEGVETLLK